MANLGSRSIQFVLKVAFLAGAAILMLGTAKEASAQITAGTLRGVVADPTRAVIPGVKVDITNLATGASYSTSTNEAGIYVITGLPVGNYSLDAEAAGFKRFSRQPINLATASTTTLDVQLEVGEVSETVTVEGTGVATLQTDSAEVSTVMERRMVIDLPLDLGGRSSVNGSGRRQIEQFLFLTPGITGTQWSKHFLGSPRHTSQAVVDGIPHALQESPGLTSRTSPPFEAVEEFKVATTQYSADQGRGFGIINYTLKSGTNEFHGTAFHFLRNDQLDARGFFQRSRPIVRQNEFGGGIGGPIIKNRTFFYAGLQAFRRRGGNREVGLITVPTEAFKRGDFGNLRQPTGALIPIFDPSTTRSDGAGGFIRDPFANNVIPVTQMSRVSRDLAQLIPSPDTPGIVNNYINRSTNPSDDNVWSAKVDHLHGPHRFSFSYWWVDNLNTGVNAWGDHIIDTGFAETFKGGGIRANWDWVMSPTVLNHFGWGFSTANKDRLPNKDVPPNPLNIPGINVSAAAQFPTVSFGTPYASLGSAGAGPDLTRDRATIFTNTVSWTKGRHQFKFGGEYWDQSFARFDGRGESGSYGFGSASTSQPNSPNFGIWGDGFASMLLGGTLNATRLINPVNSIYDTRYFAVYIDDKWQISPRLTLSLGLRYEIPQPIQKRDDTISAVNLTLPNPAAGNLPGAYVFGNEAIQPRTVKTNWGPRLGLSYKLNDKTVVRSGFGLIYAQSNALVNGMELGGNSLLAGFTTNQNPISLDNGITPAMFWDNGFPAFTGTLPNRDPGLNVGGVADFLSPSGGRPAYTVNYNFTIQRELPFNIVADIAYVGTKGTHLPSNLETLNMLNPSFLSLGPLLTAPFDSPQAQAAGITAPYPGFTGSVAQALRPFPQYTGVYTHANPIGNHTYHAMQAKAQKRFSSGLSFLTHYTIAKTISDTEGTAWSNTEPSALDTTRRYLEKAISPIDSTHLAVATIIYELPFARNSQGVVGKLAKGWQIAVSQSYQSGPPLGISGGPSLPIFNAFGGFGAGRPANRPMRVQGVDRLTGVGKSDFDPATDRLLNIAAYAQPAPFTFGDVSRTEPDIRGFSAFNENLTFSKRTYIREEFNVEFRAEFFNVFNRVQFGNPSSNINSPANFGVVNSQANAPRTIQFALKVNF